jgi:hypothetical protein
MRLYLSLNKKSLKSVGFLVLLALGFAAVFAPKSTGVSVEWPNIPHSQNQEAARGKFGELPLSFEVNQGQVDAHNLASNHRCRSTPRQGELSRRQ